MRSVLAVWIWSVWVGVAMASSSVQSGNVPVAPRFISARIQTPTVSAVAGAQAPRITFSFSAPGGYASNAFILTGPSHQTVYDSYGVAPPGFETSGTIATVPVGLFSIYTQPGIWTITYGSITDLAGTTTAYTPAQLASLFPSLTFRVVNPRGGDLQAPTVSAGEIVTGTISLSAAVPYFKATLKAADKLAGIASSAIFLAEPDGTAYPGNTYTVEPAQRNSGTIVSGALLAGTVPTGVWRITGYFVCDVAGNCLTQTDPGTLQTQFSRLTFTVTK